jgi:hypothetical protein
LDALAAPSSAPSGGSGCWRGRGWSAGSSALCKRLGGAPSRSSRATGTSLQRRPRPGRLTIPSEKLQQFGAGHRRVPDGGRSRRRRGPVLAHQAGQDRRDRQGVRAVGEDRVCSLGLRRSRPAVPHQATGAAEIRQGRGRQRRSRQKRNLPENFWKVSGEAADKVARVGGKSPFSFCYDLAHVDRRRAGRLGL